MTLTGGKLILAKDYPADADVKAYVAAVEAADEADTPGIGALELDVVKAYDNFILGCKHDGIWDAIKASCILAGARTLSGALVPLAGTAPTKFGTAANWNYNRKTGLQGDGSTNYLDSNRNNNADPQNSNHNSVYVSTAQSPGNTGFYIDSGSNGTGANNFGRSAVSGNLFLRNRCDTGTTIASGAAIGFMGHSRNQSNQYVFRVTGSNTTVNIASQLPANGTLTLFARTLFYSDARIAFYSIGESLDLALLDTRVSTLISDLGAAI